MNLPAVLLALSSAVLPQDTTGIGTPSLPWSVQTTHVREWVAEGGADRNRTSLRIGRRFGRGALFLEALRIRDFSGVGGGIGIQGYLPLWHHAEGSLHVSGAPDAPSHPDLLITAEALQHLGGGWSAGAGGGYRDYQPGSLIQAHISGGRRAGAWQIRTRTGLLSSNEEVLPLADVMVRRFVGQRDSYLELIVAGRDEVLDFLPRPDGAELLTAPTAQIMGRAQIAVTDQTSLHVAAGHSAMKGFGRRTEAEAGLSIRW